jgi:2-polyprenyl-3-methyl-5-hydroxy-6-metoxy-1,4-benzoquinol methylase
MSDRGRFDYYAAPFWRELAFLFPPMNLWRRKAIRAILEAVPDPGDGEILEIACATGALTRRLARRFPKARILAVDLSLEMIRAAERSGRDPNVEYRTADLFDLEGRYPLVVGMHILHMLPLEAFAEKLGRMVSKGGRTVQSFTSQNAVTRTYRRFYRFSRGDEVHLTDPGTVLEVLKSAGFRAELRPIDPFEGSWLIQGVRNE